jgi:hypothetical protein
MKKSILAGCALMLMSVPQMFAAIETQLFLDAGGGVTATIDVNTGNVVTCSDTGGGCLGLIFTSTADHGTLQVTGTLGTFTINATGKGELDTIDPTKQNLNQIEVQNAGGAGTLIAIFTDTDYVALGSQFILAASTTIDSQIATSTVDFSGLGSAANSVPAGTLIGSFLGLTGNSASASGTFANPIGATGSLTTNTVLNFSGAGAIQANFTISTAGTQVPEPASISLLGTVLLFGTFVARRKFKRA